MPFLKLFFLLLIIQNVSLGQKSNKFEGILTYTISEVKSKDSIEGKAVIFCKDSLIKVVNFETNNRQELLKHLTYKKSYILVEIDSHKYAIRTNEHLEKDTVTYSMKKKCSSKKIGGLKSKKIVVKYAENKLPLTCYYHKKISSKYANAMRNFPGLPTLFYTFSDNGIFRHTLSGIENKELPISLFSIPKEYQIVTWEDFLLMQGQE